MIRIATRSSAQARTQAEVVASAITAASGEATQLIFVETLGDINRDVPLHQLGGQGIFVKEVQQAVLQGLADVAIHSAKDLPSMATDGLTVSAWCERRDARDALVGNTLEDLAQGATVATGSVRRRAQLLTVRPDLQFVDLRGNINTRLEKIPAGGAIVMAIAALEVLGLTQHVAQALDPSVFVPMIGQGCVAVECRTDDAATRGHVSVVDHAATRRSVEIERAFLAELGAGCSMPVGAHLDANDVLHMFMATGDTPNDRHAKRALPLPVSGDALEFARENARAVRASLQ
jgi:hydroxymethylbilane synthase